ncbi:ParA family partition ATPase [Larkinella ripae]
MKIICVASQKGGCGKTTLSLNLAYFFSGTLRVALADTDPQGSASGLSGLLENITIIKLDDLLKAEILDEFDLLICDTPPYLSTRLPELFAISDYVLVPTKPGYLDAMAIKGTVELLERSMKTYKRLRAGILLTMVQYRTSITEEVRALIKETYSIPLLNTTITQRVSYMRSPISNGIFNLEDLKAQAEIVDLATEIMDQLDLIPR